MSDYRLKAPVGTSNFLPGQRQVLKNERILPCLSIQLQSGLEWTVIGLCVALRLNKKRVKSLGSKWCKSTCLVHNRQVEVSIRHYRFGQDVWGDIGYDWKCDGLRPKYGNLFPFALHLSCRTSSYLNRYLQSYPTLIRFSIMSQLELISLNPDSTENSLSQKPKLQQLESFLWESADIIRGRMDASEFKTIPLVCCSWNDCLMLLMRNVKRLSSTSWIVKVPK